MFHTFEFLLAVPNGLLHHSLLVVVHGIEFKAGSFRAYSFLPRLLKVNGKGKR